MKSFFQFLLEAAETQAATQAKRLGLVGDGHGAWKDRAGKYVAKTENGKLRFFSKRNPAKKEEPETKTPKPAPPASLPKVAASKVAPRTRNPTVSKTSSTKSGSETDVDSTGEDKGVLTIVFGRFNPPTIGHEKLFNTADKVAVGNNLKIYPSRTQDSKKNPLKPDDKISFMRKMFPKFGERIVNDEDMKTVFDVLIAASEDGYKLINIVVGSDRQSEFESLANKHNGDLYSFDEIQVISSGMTDSDSDNVEGMSASKMRKAAAEDDFSTFKRGMPKELNDAEVNKLFSAVKSGMKLKEGYEMWQIAPKFDWKNLRENYVSGQIFKEGDVVENLNTGITGTVIRRGTNYLIYVTENDIMFKSWIKDLNEYTEVKMERNLNNSNIHRFINKYKIK